MVTASWMLRQDPITAIIPFILLLPARIRWPPQSYGADDISLKPCTLKELWPRSQPFEKTDRPPAVLGGWRPKVPGVTYWYCKPGSPGRSFLLLQMNDVFRFIEANITLPIGLCDVNSWLLPAYLTNLVRQQTGQSVPVDCQAPDGRGAFLALESKQLVNQIAAAVGYADACNFSRHFRQIHGTSPQAWRSAHRR